MRPQRLGRWWILVRELALNVIVHSVLTSHFVSEGLVHAITIADIAALLASLRVPYEHVIFRLSLTSIQVAFPPTAHTPPPKTTASLPRLRRPRPRPRNKITRIPLPPRRRLPINATPRILRQVDRSRIPLVPPRTGVQHAIEDCGLASLLCGHGGAEDGSVAVGFGAGHVEA